MQRSLNPVLLSCVVVAAGVAWIVSLRVPANSVAANIASTHLDRTALPVATTIAASKTPRASKADPFWPPEPPKPVVIQLAPAALPPPPPPKPTLPYKFFGRITNPDGRQSIFVSRENEQFELKPGAIFEGQFKVESMSETRVVFEHIASGEKLEMVLPPAPKNGSGSGL